jgi:hypothetical protein
MIRKAMLPSKSPSFLFIFIVRTWKPDQILCQRICESIKRESSMEYFPESEQVAPTLTNCQSDLYRTMMVGNLHEETMGRERALKLTMIAAGLLFSAGIYPLAMSLWRWRQSDEIVPMFLSLYVTLGVFLLISARNPSRHRTLISFAAWSSLAHVAVMMVQACNNAGGRPELFGMSAILIAVGAPLLALAPARQEAELPAAPEHQEQV